jgi:hypothetical protein
MAFLWFSFCFLFVFLGFLGFEIPRKQKENKKKTQENPRKPEEKKTTAPPYSARTGITQLPTQTLGGSFRRAENQHQASSFFIFLCLFLFLFRGLV